MRDAIAVGDVEAMLPFKIGAIGVEHCHAIVAIDGEVAVFAVAEGAHRGDCRCLRLALAQIAGEFLVVPVLDRGNRYFDHLARFVLAIGVHLVVQSNGPRRHGSEQRNRRDAQHQGQLLLDSQAIEQAHEVDHSRQSGDPQS